MSYSAAISLDQTIHRLLNSPDRISISSSSQKKLKNAQKLVKSLKEVLQTLDGKDALGYSAILESLAGDDLNRKIDRFRDARGKSSEKLTALDGQIRDAMYSFEDVLDSILSDKSLSKHYRYKRGRSSTFLSLDLDTDEVWQEIKTLAKTVKKLMEEFDTEIDCLILNEDDVAVEVNRSSYMEFGVEMVGRSIKFSEIKDQILRRLRPSDFAVFSILGVVGTGRTAVARESFEYLSTEASGKYFDCGAWVTAGPNFQIKEIITLILAQIDDSSNNLSSDDTKTLTQHLHECLKNRRYMIVIDDVRDQHVWDELKSSFPEEENGSVVMLTTGMKEVALSANSLHIFQMTVYDEKESWGILEQGIFGGKSCPLELEEAGMKIAKNCGGRRIALAKVVVLMLEAERKAEFWKELAEDEENSIFMVADELCEKLRSLKCVVVNPELGVEVVFPHIPPTLPSSLKKLKLSGLGLPWEYISMISKLHSLSIKDCYNLEQLPSSLPVRLKNIQVFDTHLPVTNWAKKMKDKNWERR